MGPHCLGTTTATTAQETQSTLGPQQMGDPDVQLLAPVSCTTDSQQGSITTCGPATPLYLENPWGTRHELNPVCRPGTAKICIYPQTRLRARHFQIGLSKKNMARLIMQHVVRNNQWLGMGHAIVDVEQFQLMVDSIYGGDIQSIKKDH